MRIVRARNVNDAYRQGLIAVMKGGKREESRNGPVIVMDSPVMTIYERPHERVLFDSSRDANPFFHLTEALWMLAGRDDSGLLTQFVKSFGDYAEEDGRIHGAYGHRWRHAMGFDQLAVIVETLRKDPTSRQCVLQMWDARPHIGSAVQVTDDLRGAWRDRPCNTQAFFRVRTLDSLMAFESEKTRVLDLTVTCRSNDVIWGCYGANAVHFSVLQEYVAAAIGAHVGTYYQLSNNFHVYDNAVLQRCWPMQPEMDHYGREDLRPRPMVADPRTFLPEVETLLKSYEANHERIIDLDNTFLSRTVWPMLRAHVCYRTGDYDKARSLVGTMEAEDWRLACAMWLSRRINKREAA